MNSAGARKSVPALLLVLGLLTLSVAAAQALDTLTLDTPDFTLKLLASSQTMASLQPKGAGSFDFAPADRLESRAGDGFNAIGDITLRIRKGTSGSWENYSTSAARHPVRAMSGPGFLAVADLSPTLAPDCPIQVTRRWLLDDGRLVLRFELKNTSSDTVQVGALGLPMVFNNMLKGRPLTEMVEVNSFSDPAINQDGGYLQVTRLNGHGPALVVVPADGKTPFEAWRLLNEPNGPNNLFSRGNPYEGAFEWMVHSAAYAENEWKGKEQWSPPTMASLEPGQSRSYSVKFLVSPDIRNIEKTLIANKRPVAVGIPGYILPMDLNAKLFLNYPSRVTSIKSEPAGAIVVQENKPTQGGWKDYTLQGKTWGRVRLSISYADRTTQALSYYVIKPASQTVADLGNFLFTKQWYVNPDDPFHRSPSVMTYDRANNPSSCRTRAPGLPASAMKEAPVHGWPRR